MIYSTWGVHYTVIVHIKYRRKITWVVLGVLLAQVLIMTVHHVTHGTTAAPSASVDHAAHDHSGNHDNGNVSVEQSSHCAFWLSLHCGATYVPEFATALSVRPSPLVAVRLPDAPTIRPQHLLTHLSSRGPPRFC